MVKEEIMESQIKIGDAIYVVSSDDNYLRALGNDFEPKMVQLFCALVQPSDIVADVGANIGLTAILFSSLAKKVYAFEASPSTCRILSANLARNSIANVEAINLGLGQRPETLSITFANNNRSGGFISDKIRPLAGHVTEEIRIDSLDHYFAGKRGLPTFLKIDVEGFEQNVIKGGAGLLRMTKPAVVMEMNHFCLDVLQRITIPEFLDFMRSFFPCLYAVDADNMTVIDLHVPDQAYMVMHEHVVRHRFPNLVGGFDPAIKLKLDGLAHAARDRVAKSNLEQWRYQKADGKIVAQATVRTVGAGECFEIPVIVSNESREIWHGSGEHPVLLSYHWRRRDGSFSIYDGVRTELQCVDLSPGKVWKQTMRVIAPSEIGDFELVLTLVQEGVFWFESQGFKCTSWSVAVI